MNDIADEVAPGGLSPTVRQVINQFIASMRADDGFPGDAIKAHKQLPILRAALTAHQAKHAIDPDLEQQVEAAWLAQPAMPAKQISTKSGTTPLDAGDLIL